MRIVITEIGWDGNIRRGALDISRLIDAGRWENLIEQVLAVPPPHRATPRSAVYVIHAGDRAVLAGEENLLGSLQELVTTILAAGERALAAHACGSGHSHRLLRSLFASGSCDRGGPRRWSHRMALAGATRASAGPALVAEICCEPMPACRKGRRFHHRASCF